MCQCELFAPRHHQLLSIFATLFYSPRVTVLREQAALLHRAGPTGVRLPCAPAESVYARNYPGDAHDCAAAGTEADLNGTIIDEAAYVDANEVHPRPAASDEPLAPRRRGATSSHARFCTCGL